MPVVEIRETLTGKILDDDTNLPGMIQKRINLPHGKRFRVLSIECFDDNMGIMPTNGAGVTTTREIYVTPFPIVPSNMAFGFTEAQRNATEEAGYGLGS